MDKEEIKASAPGRLCLLGEHQDYFGLPIIAAAINLRIFITAHPIADKKIKLDLPDIGEKDEFPLGEELSYSKERDYLKSAVNILLRKNIFPKSGWKARVQGTIPINSGTASSSALVVAWIGFLLKAAKEKKTALPQKIAELAFQSEVAEFKEPGGKMDHYSSALGQVISIRFGKKLKVNQFKSPLKEFVLADSLIRKDTTGTLGFIKSNVLKAVSRIKNKAKDFNLQTPLSPQIKEEIEKLPEIENRLLKGTLMTRDLTAQGETLFKKKIFDHKKFGRLLTRQQEVIQNYLQISSPKIDKMIKASLDEGALGAKINGSGEGGCIFAYAPNRAEQVAKKLDKLGAKSYIVHVDQGIKIQGLNHHS
ncbi:MAG: mevalonate kinase [Acidobacteriota bacterium]